MTKENNARIWVNIEALNVLKGGNYSWSKTSEGDPKEYVEDQVGVLFGIPVILKRHDRE